MNDAGTLFDNEEALMLMVRRNWLDRHQGDLKILDARKCRKPMSDIMTTLVGHITNCHGSLVMRDET